MPQEKLLGWKGTSRSQLSLLTPVQVCVELVPQAVPDTCRTSGKSLLPQGNLQPTLLCLLSHAYLSGWPGPQPGIILQLRTWLSSTSLVFSWEQVVRHDCCLSHSFYCISFGLHTLAKRYLSEDWCNKFHAISPVSEVFSAHYSSSSRSWTDSLY